MKVGNNGKKQEESKGGGVSGKETSSASNDLSKITPRTEEERYTAMLLDMMRGANKQDRAAILVTINSFLATIDSFYPRRNEATEAMDTPFSRKHASSKEEKGREEGQTPPEKEPGKRKMTIEFSYEDQDTVEYGFYFINAVLAATQRISKEDEDGQTEQVPADFYYIVDEARERLDKIRVILGYLRETT